MNPETKERMTMALVKKLMRSDEVEMRNLINEAISKTYALGFKDGEAHKGEEKRKSYMTGHEDGERKVREEQKAEAGKSCTVGEVQGSHVHCS